MVERRENCNQGYRHWIKFIAFVTALVTCLYATLHYTGYIGGSFTPKLVYSPFPQFETKAPEERSVPVIPVLNADWNQRFPKYKNVPEDVYNTNWWMAAAFLQWDLEQRPVDHRCRNIKAVGNWWICMDHLYQIKRPCLVYSFGIANDFTFDDAMASHGCEVHSFDPSMKTADYVRKTSVRFHALGLGGHTEEKFQPRKDIYVKDNTTWAIMTLNLIKTSLGHKNRVIDVLKIDVEGHEWEVLESLFADNMFPQVRQFMLEYHLFPDWPAKSEYSKILRTYKKLHDMGFKKFVTAMHPLEHNPKKFNIQADVAYINTRYSPHAKGNGK